MFNRIREMLIKEFIQVFRDPRMRGVILILPCIEVLVIGYAVNMDIRDIRAGIYDQDNTPASRELLSRFSGNGYFDVVAHIASDRQMDELVDRSQVQIVFRVNSGFQGDLESGRTATLQVVCDGTDSNTAGIALSYVNGITGDFSRAMLQSRLQRSRPAAELPVRLDLRTRAWFNSNLDSRNFFVPGVIVIVVSLVSLLLDEAMAVVSEKGDRHHRADHGHAHHTGRVHPRQNAAVRAHRLCRRDADFADRQVLVPSAPRGSIVLLYGSHRALPG